MCRHGFTLIEALVVIGIIALMAGILMPVFLAARGKARQTECASNLRQIGNAVFLYASDYDGEFPLGGDAVDLNTDTWQYAYGGKLKIAGALQPLQSVMNPYVRSPRLWKCPSDNGYDSPDFSSGISAHPSSFAQYGLSYLYHTEIVLRGETLSGLVAYDNDPPYAQHGPAEIDLLQDSSGSWHGAQNQDSMRFNVLMADGHVVNMTYAGLNYAWNLQLVNPLSQ